MLEIFTPENTKFNIVAPTVFIQNVEIINNSIKINYFLEDLEKAWSNKKNILENLDVVGELSSSVGVETKKIKLNAVVLNNSTNDNRYYGHFLYSLNSSAEIKAIFYCNNVNISGPQTIEQIKTNNSFANASIERRRQSGNQTIVSTEEFLYLSKIIDLNLLDIKPFSFSQFSSSTLPIIEKEDLLISYRPTKQANLGFIINLEPILDKYSAAFRYLKGYPEFKNFILKNSYINKNLTFFYKKNITANDADYTKINSTVNTYKLSDTDHNYLVTISDDNTDSLDLNYYEVKCKISVYDFSYDLFANECLNKLEIAKRNLLEYKNTFEILSKQKLIKNLNIYFYQNEYEKYVSKIQEVINNLSPLYSFINQKTLEEYIKFFTSILHPLFLNISNIELILNSLEKLKKTISVIVNEINYFGTPNEATLETKLLNLEFEHKFINQFNYNYNENYGFEVISTDDLAVRRNEPKNGLKVLELSEEKFVRKLFEARKFISNSSQEETNSINYFTISRIDFGNISYLLDQTANGFFDELFIKLREYNSYNFNFDKLQSSYLQIFTDGICINTIANGLNNSPNDLQRSVLFDPNLASQQQSLQFITSTGVQKLLLLLDDETDLKDIQTKIPNNSIQYRGAFEINTSLSTRPFFLTNQIINDISAAPKILFYYKTLYNDRKLINISNTNYDIYSLDEVYVNKFVSETSRMRHFNKYYLVFNKNPENPPSSIATVNFSKDLLLNIEPRYLNRKELPAKILVGVN